MPVASIGFCLKPDGFFRQNPASTCLRHCPAAPADAVAPRMTRSSDRGSLTAAGALSFASVPPE